MLLTREDLGVPEVKDVNHEGNHYLMMFLPISEEIIRSRFGGSIGVDMDKLEGQRNYYVAWFSRIITSMGWYSSEYFTVVAKPPVFDLWEDDGFEVIEKYELGDGELDFEEEELMLIGGEILYEASEEEFCEPLETYLERYATN